MSLQAELLFQYWGLVQLSSHGASKRAQSEGGTGAAQTKILFCSLGDKGFVGRVCDCSGQLYFIAGYGSRIDDLERHLLVITVRRSGLL
jgi:hypothetical protein